MATTPNTTNAARCMECGQSLRGEALEGFCPRCLSRLAFDADPEAGGSVSAVVRSVGDYEFIEEIGRGGMGVVWKARQRSLNRIVALKFILAGSFASREFIERFRAEATAAARLKHPNIVAVHEVGEHEGHHYFSMDFIEGRSLAQLVRAEPPSLRQSARYLRLIAEAIHHAHERGIVHRDLKPSNILVDAAGEPHITDFGLARELNSADHLTLSSQALGSPSFAAPEQIGGARLVSVRPIADAPSEVGSRVPAGRATRAPLSRSVDIYGLGAILYHSLTGRPPFVGATLANVLRAVQEDEPVSPRLLNPEIPRDLETICLKCLEKEPTRRYATAQELADELGRFLNGEPINARPVSRAERVLRWCRRKPALATAYAVVLLLVLVLVIGSPIAAYRINQARKAEAAERERAEANLYASDMNLAYQAIQGNNLGRATTLLERHRPGFGVPASAGSAPDAATVVPTSAAPTGISVQRAPDRLKAGLQTDRRGYPPGPAPSRVLSISVTRRAASIPIAFTAPTCRSGRNAADQGGWNVGVMEQWSDEAGRALVGTLSTEGCARLRECPRPALGRKRYQPCSPPATALSGLGRTGAFNEDASNVRKDLECGG